MPLSADSQLRPDSIGAANDIIARATQEVSDAAVVREPLLSVSILAYNQRPFIRQAVESVLQQQTDFPFEIVIGDDHSDDGTSDILREIQRSHPDKIRLLTATENLGQYTGNGRLNMIRTLRACRGKYVALLEGDDYWTSPQKLQRQVTALQAHPNWAVCFHLTRFFWDDGSETPFDYPLQFDRQVSTVEHLFVENFMQTCSVVFRNRLFGEFPDWFLEVGLGDWPLHILNAQYGAIGFLPESMAAYRVHPNGLWTSKPAEECEQIVVQMYLLLQRNLPQPLSDLAMQALVARFTSQIDALNDQCQDHQSSMEMLNHHIAKLNVQYQQSPSYRLGRSLLAPLRALRGLLHAQVPTSAQ